MRPALACLLLASPVLANLLGCSPAEQLILPGKLDLLVAKGDRIKLCPDDGVTDTTPDADCIIGPAKDALGPYANELSAKGWRTGDGKVWTAPEVASSQTSLAQPSSAQPNSAQPNAAQ